MNLENTVLSEISHKRTKQVGFHSQEGPRTVKFKETENRMVAVGGSWEGITECPIYRIKGVMGIDYNDSCPTM